MCCFNCGTVIRRRRPTIKNKANPSNLFSVVMELNEEATAAATTTTAQQAAASSTYTTPFPTNSVNLLVASTNSGKSTLVLNIIKHQTTFLTKPAKKIIVVLCNDLIDNSAFYLDGVDPDLAELIQITTLTNFNLAEDLIEGSFLIFEDVQILTTKITDAVNLHAHHGQLESVFIIVQVLLNSDLFKLISLAHRVVLFFNSAAATRLSKYIVSTFFLDSELKQYLHKIIVQAERNKCVLLLDINQINGKCKPRFLAISGLDHLADMKPAIVYPHMNEQNNYDTEFEDYEADVENNATVSSMPSGSFLLVPAKNVKKISRNEAGGPLSENVKNENKKKEWEQMVHIVEKNINDNVPFKKRGPAKSVAVAMLECNKFTVSNDGKIIWINGDETKSTIPMLDFVMTAIRQSGPNEPVNPVFKKYMVVLMRNHTPRSFFKNKSLLQAGGQTTNKRKRQEISVVSRPSTLRRKNGKKRNEERNFDMERS